MEHAVKVDTRMKWSFETDELPGICVLADEPMVVVVRFEDYGNRFYDVLQMQHEIKARLLTPASVEGLCQFCVDIWPQLRITVRGRSETHGWIEVVREAGGRDQFIEGAKFGVDCLTSIGNLGEMLSDPKPGAGNQRLKLK